jgi:hypothetical protein
MYRVVITGPSTPVRGEILVVSASGDKRIKVEGTTPLEYPVTGAEVYLNIQRQSRGRFPMMTLDKNGRRELDQDPTSPSNVSQPHLLVEIQKNGVAIKSQRTTAPFGVVSLSTVARQGGMGRYSELVVDGTVKYAFVTMTNEKGDTEQELVPVPFSKVFYPREGWIVGITAQKTEVTRPDPLSVRNVIEVLDDGVRGTMHVAIKVSGRLVAEETTSVAYGVASATAVVK